MKKNKLLGIAIATIMTMSSIIPAFATDLTAQDPTSKVATVETQQFSEADKLAKLTQRAAKLGADITGLTSEQARDKIRAAVALKLGVDITGLSKEDANSRIQSARASKLGVDITGLSKEDAKAKIKAALEAKNIAKLTERATKLGLYITGLSK
jgi:hypothetical protein